MTTDPILKLRSYQLEAVDFLHRPGKGKALFLDMGLGKTATCLCALTRDHLPALVVAPKRVAEFTWAAERDIWAPHLSVTVVKGTPQKRAAALAVDADLTVISRENLAEAAQKAASGYFKTLIIDELSGYKNQATQRFKGASMITPFVQHVWGLTGTPTPKGLLDLYSQIKLLDGGLALGRTLTAYRERFFLPSQRFGNFTQWLPKAGAETKVYKAIEHLVLSQGTEGRVELPEVTYVTHPVRMTASAVKAYKKMRDEMSVWLASEGEEITAQNAAVASGKLSQITSGFLYQEADIDAPESAERPFKQLHRSKLDKLEDLVEAANGSPVLVFYRFAAELQMLQAHPKLGPLVSTVKDKDFVDKWNNGEIPILAAHPESIGHGLNLQKGGHIAVWLSLPWSSEAWLQSNKRLHRSGQEHPVTIHILEVPNSIDEHVYARLTDKVDAQQALLDYLKKKDDAPGV